jgi:hypothetical protein
MNMIAPCCHYMMMQTTKDGPPSARTKAKKRWLKTWNGLSLKTIQQEIKRIMYHIQEIICLLMGDEYVESACFYQHLQNMHNNIKSKWT